MDRIGVFTTARSRPGPTPDGQSAPRGWPAVPDVSQTAGGPGDTLALYWAHAGMHRTSGITIHSHHARRALLPSIGWAVVTLSLLAAAIVAADCTCGSSSDCSDLCAVT